MAGLAAAVVTHTAVQDTAANAAVTAPPAQGTDVSNLTTVTSWASVKAAGITFTGVMAFDGATVSNPSYNTQVTGALAQGLFVMPYVVADPLKIAGAAQFAKAWPVIDGIASAPYAGGGQYLPVALDMEAQPQVTSDACYGLSKAQMVAWIQAFLTAAQQPSRQRPPFAVPLVDEEQTTVVAAEQRDGTDRVGRSAGTDGRAAQRRRHPPERCHRRLAHPAHPRSRTVGFRRGKAFADRQLLRVLRRSVRRDARNARGR